MGCGKSKIGRKLAPALGYALVDTDKLIEGLAGCTVAEIFAKMGEEWFRKTERKLIESVDKFSPDTVVSTGGGVPCFGDNMDLMNKLGTTVYLKRSPANIVSRISEHGRAKRPAISGMNDAQLLEYINKNLPAREPFYSKASLVIDCDAMDDDHIIEIIQRHIERTNNSNK